MQQHSNSQQVEAFIRLATLQVPAIAAATLPTFSQLFLACRCCCFPRRLLCMCASCVQAGPGLLAAGAAGLLGVDTAGAAAAAATRWSLAFSPLLEYAALLTGLGRWVGFLSGRAWYVSGVHRCGPNAMLA